MNAVSVRGAGSFANSVWAPDQVRGLSKEFIKRRGRERQRMTGKTSRGVDVSVSERQGKHQEAWT